jgi:predicted Fe-Mo cluster-binding NifX family protein
MTTFKIAVTSEDGEIVDTHFGHADEIRFYEVDEQRIRYLGLREVEKYCDGNEPCGAGKSDAISSLNDCAALVTRMIGAVPERALSEMGVRVFLAYEPVEDALRSAYGKLL